MAGNYADMPSTRLAWDRDGTRLFYDNLSSLTEQVDAVRQALNNESNTLATLSLPTNGHRAVWLFGVPTTIDYGWFTGSSTMVFTLEGSTNTTNGSDGTWSGLVGSTSQATRAIVPTYRQTPYLAISGANLKGLRMVRQAGWAGNLGKAHLFGKPTTGHRLRFWHPTLDQEANPNLLEWGDRARASNVTKQFRVKNLSPTYTAKAVRIAQEALTDTVPSVPGQHQISQNGGMTWGAQQTIGDLAPGAISGTLLIKQDLLSTAVLSVWAHRLFVEASTWEV